MAELTGLYGGDGPSRRGIEKYLSPACPALRIEVVKSATSTNALMRDSAERGAPEGSVVIALSQSAGRGRQGRAFLSRPGAGIYMSVLLRPKGWPVGEATRLTTMAAVAVCEAIEEVTGEKALIKWVNDVFVRGKKVCGILTEAACTPGGPEGGAFDCAVVGVGINVYEPEGGFPDDIRSVAGAVLESPLKDAKNRLAAAFLNRFMAYYASGSRAECSDKYRARSIVTGKRVTVISGSGQRQAVAMDIDEDCRLRVMYDDGSCERLFSGEISVKL